MIWAGVCGGNSSRRSLSGCRASQIGTVAALEVDLRKTCNTQGEVSFLRSRHRGLAEGHMVGGKVMGAP